MSLQFVRVRTKNGDEKMYQDAWTNEQDDAFLVYRNQESSALEPDDSLVLLDSFLKSDLDEVVMDGVVVLPKENVPKS